MEPQMSQNGLKALESELGAPPPPAVCGLPDESLQALAGAVRTARHRQAAALAAAREGSLEFIPRLLRGPVRKVVGS
jgi:hypothetical protein